MPVSITHMRELLLPGLYSVYEVKRYDRWGNLFTETIAVVDTAVPLPTVSLPAAVAMGVAAAVISNPPVTRRLLSW